MDQANKAEPQKSHDLSDSSWSAPQTMFTSSCMSVPISFDHQFPEFRPSTTFGDSYSSKTLSHNRDTWPGLGDSVFHSPSRSSLPVNNDPFLGALRAQSFEYSPSNLPGPQYQQSAKFSDSGYGSVPSTASARHLESAWLPPGFQEDCRLLKQAGKVIKAVKPGTWKVERDSSGSSKLKIDLTPYPYLIWEVRAKSNHVLAFRIQIHGSKGCGGRSNTDEHCIIYTPYPRDPSWQPPRLPNEDAMQPNPLRVSPARASLDPLSRLDFGRKIELDFHTAVIQEIGDITPDSMKVLQGYVDDCDRSYRIARSDTELRLPEESNTMRRPPQQRRGHGNWRGRGRGAPRGRGVSMDGLLLSR